MHFFLETTVKGSHSHYPPFKDEKLRLTGVKKLAELRNIACK